MSDGAVAYDTVRVPPFFAPATSGAGPLAVGSSAAAIVPPSVAFVPPVPAFLAGAAHAAVNPIDAKTPTARTLVQRMFCSFSSAVPTTVGRELPDGSGARYRRVLGSNASRIASPSRVRARTRKAMEMTGGQRNSCLLYTSPSPR